MRSRKGVVFFDIGDTLIKVYEQRFWKAIAEYLGTTADELDAFINAGNVPLRYRFNVGMSEESMYESLLPLTRRKTKFEEFMECFRLWLSLCVEENEPQYFRRLMELLISERYRLGVISNVDRISAAICREQEFYFWNYIERDLRFYSYELGYCKGRDPHAYYAVFRKCPTRPRYLIDNLEENIIGFEQAGGRGFCFRVADSLSRELIAEGLLPEEPRHTSLKRMGLGMGEIIAAPSEQAKSLERRFVILGDERRKK